MRRFLAILTALVSLMAPSAMAQEREIAVLDALLSEAPAEAAQFAPAFLAAMPVEQLQPVLDGIKSAIGPVETITHQSDMDYLVETASHTIQAQIGLDADGRITGIFFRPAIAKDRPVADVLGELSAIAPQSAYLVTLNGEVVHAHNADQPLAVGSAFKLGILAALNDSIDGPDGWATAIPLRAEDISLPSGILQTWPVGAPVTLDTLANLMISMSDNTATDALLHHVGRDAVEAKLGIAPVLSTRELFVLKSTPDLLERYQNGDTEERRAVLADVAERPLPSVSRILDPHVPGVEWDIPLTTLCPLIEQLRELRAFAINPGVASRADWSSIAFKGGSETGVLNFTTAVTDDAGNVYCVAASWNAPQAIDEAAAGNAYAGLLAALARGN